MEAFTVTGGLRYTKEKKDYTFLRVNPDGSINFFVDPTGTLNGSTSKYSGDKTDYRLSADYRWSPKVLTYATVSTGFKGGGIGPRPFIATQAAPFGQETLTSYEIGVKTDFFDNRLRANAAAFFNKYKDIQLSLLSCPAFSPGPGFPCALPQNAGDADVKGIELEVVAEPAPGLNIDASISTLDFDYTELDPSTGLSKADVAPFTPKLKWSAGAQYEVSLGNYGSLIPRVDVAHQNKMFTNADNGPLNTVAAYTIANAHLAWAKSEQGSHGRAGSHEHHRQILSAKPLRPIGRQWIGEGFARPSARMVPSGAQKLLSVSSSTHPLFGCASTLPPLPAAPTNGRT
ncbi:MAG: TonB-dependent receptor [Caulobacterales bacterium]